MSRRYKVSFIGDRWGNRVTRTNEFTRTEASEDVRHLRSLGYRGIEVVPVRASARARAHGRHLYRNGAEPREMREFEERYGKKKGDYVYGATVGKVKRERAAKRGA